MPFDARRVVLIAVLALLAGCGGRAAGTLPPTGQHADVPTARSVSPASVPAPPMAHTATQPSSTMTALLPKSAIQPVGWTQIPGGATAVAASPDGSMWVLSSLGNGPDRAIWHYANGTWTNIPGAAMRLATAPDNSLWVVNSAGGIYHYTNGAWSTIAGGASDITVASDGSLYVISNQAGGQYGNGIWHYTGGAWAQMPGAGVRIAASWDPGTYPNGIAPGGFWVTNAAQSIYYYNPSSGFTQIPGAAVWLAPSNAGGLFVLGVPNGPAGYPIYYNDLGTQGWTAQSGAAVSIATDGAHVYAIGAAGGIYVAPVQAPPHQPSLIGVGCGALCQLFAPYTGTPTAIAAGLNAPYVGNANVLHFLSTDAAGDLIAFNPFGTPYVRVYRPPYTGAPVEVTNGVGTPTEVTVDGSNGTLFVASTHPYQTPTYTITAYAPPFTGAPFATMPDHAYLMTVDPIHELLALEPDNSGYFAVYVYGQPYASPPQDIGSWFGGTAQDMAVDPTNTYLYVMNLNEQGVSVLPNGSNPTVTQIAVPHGDLENRIVVDAHGNLFVAVNGRGQSVIPGTIYEYSPPSFNLVNTITTGSFLPVDMALDSSGNLFVAGYNNAGVRMYAPPYNGTPLTISGLNAPLLWMP